jgi:protein TonB
MFDFLPETRGNGKTLQSRFLSTAVAAHGVLLAVIVGGSFLARVDAGEDPPKPYEIYHVTIMQLPAGDDIHAGGGGKKMPDPKPPEPKAPEPDPATVQPVAVPEATPATPAPEPPPAATTPVEPTGEPGEGTGGGSGGGNGKGKGPGNGSGENPGTQGVPGGEGKDMPPDDAILDVTGDMQTPLLIHRVEPEYPEFARQAHKQGDVILQVVVGTDGKVESVKVLKSEPLLDRAAVKAVAQWIYRPSIYRGRPVKVYVTVFVSFHLD